MQRENIIFESDRHFVLHCQFVTHQNLLIRSYSTSSDDLLGNIDIHFMSVQYLEIPTSMLGLKIVLPTLDEIESIKNKNSQKMPNDLSIYKLISKDKEFFIVAGRMLISTNQLHSLDSGFVTVERKTEKRIKEEDILVDLQLKNVG